MAPTADHQLAKTETTLNAGLMRLCQFNRELQPVLDERYIFSSIMRAHAPHHPVFDDAQTTSPPPPPDTPGCRFAPLTEAHLNG